MPLEEQRFLHEDIERLEQAIADRVTYEPKFPRDRLARDHEVAHYLDRIASQSKKLLEIYKDADASRSREIQQIGSANAMDQFYKELGDIKEFHTQYPSEPVENLERAYKPKKGPDAERQLADLDSKFTGEEAFGRFFDLHTCHEMYLNLPNAKRLSYIQYLDIFDNFAPGTGGIKRTDKLTDQYFQYVGELTSYLESFMRRTRPLENVDKTLAEFDDEFSTAWEKDEIADWALEDPKAAKSAEGGPSGDGIWCEACQKEFTSQGVYNGHLTGKKHKRAEAERAAGGAASHTEPSTNGTVNQRIKERAIAQREARAKRLAAAMSTERGDTRVNVERKQGMTERERAQELAKEMAQMSYFAAGQSHGENGEDGEGDEDDDDDDTFSNPLKLPIAWDGKPIPFWLYKLHGLGVEFPCEVCGNFVYMGRRAFDKHFNEARHIHGLKCLGVTNTALFRDITRIDEALRLWEKIQAEKRKHNVDDGSLVQMEDAEGNVMPEKVYYDLQKQGLL